MGLAPSLLKTTLSLIECPEKDFKVAGELPLFTEFQSQIESVRVVKFLRLCAKVKKFIFVFHTSPRLNYNPSQEAAKNKKSGLKMASKLVYGNFLP